MAFFNRFPYTNFHELNLDWILERLNEITGANLVKSVNNVQADSAGNISITDADIPGGVKTVNSQTPDSDGNVDVGTVRSICGYTPDSVGDIVAVRSVSYRSPDSVGNIMGVLTVNSSTPDSNGNVDVGTVKSVNSTSPDSAGNVNVGTVKSVNNTTPDSAGNVSLPTVSGVTSVNNIGADGDGNVQLSASNVGAVPVGNLKYKIFKTVSDLSLPTGTTLATIWSTLGDHEIIICPASDLLSGQTPTANGMLTVCKDSALDSTGYIEFHGQEFSDADYRMFLDGNGDPTGTWNLMMTSDFTYSTTGITFATGVTVVAGGYCQVGKLVLLNMRISCAQAIAGGSSVMSGLPPVNMGVSGTTGVVPITVNQGGISLRKNGTIVTFSTDPISPGDTIMLATSYICE